MSENVPACAYSYLRFSNLEQRKGDSIRRQMALAAAWCERNNAVLDGAVQYRDEGKSAFRGANRADKDKDALAAFLSLVEEGKIERGSYLLIENLDRLSREAIRPALTLLLGLIERGIRVVQLSPRELIFDDQLDTMTLMIAVMELSRGHGESAIKSKRIAEEWGERREAARAGKAMAGAYPYWLIREGDKFVIRPGAAEAVRRIFCLAAKGYGVGMIVDALRRAEVPPFGRSKGWKRAYVAILLRDRRVTGEFQPRTRDGEPAGAPMPTYYPTIIEPAGWDRVQGIRATSTAIRGRDRKHVNIFKGFLQDAQTRTMTTLVARASEVLVTSNAAQEGLTGQVSFPYAILEEAVCRMLREAQFVELLDDQAGASVEQLDAERALIEADLVELEREIEGGYSATLGKAVRRAEGKLAKVNEALRDARRSAAHPVREARDDTRRLAGMIASAKDKDDVRLKLRTALRRAVTFAYMLTIVRGRDRFAVVQIHWREVQPSRSFLITYRMASKGRKAGAWVESMEDEAGGLDMTDDSHVDALREAIQALDVPAHFERLEASGRALQAPAGGNEA